MGRHLDAAVAAMSHAWGAGRLFIWGGDAIYCYDLGLQIGE